MAKKNEKLKKQDENKKTNLNKKGASNKRVSTSAKQKNSTQKEMSIPSGNELTKLSTILVCIIGVVCAFYILTVLISKNDSDLHYTSDNKVSQISYTEILGSDILKKNGTYYVLVEDKKDSYIDLFETYISNYKEHKVYTVDLNTAFNQKYKDDNSDIANLKFSGNTLLKITGGQIVESYETNEKINEYLKSLVTK